MLGTKMGYMDSTYPLANTRVDEYAFAGNSYLTRYDIEKTTGKL